MQKASSDGVPNGPKSPPYLMSDAIRRNHNAIRMKSACTQHALSVHSDAISMQSACDQHAISMQLACISAPELARRSGHQQSLVDPVPNAAALQDAPLADHLMRDAIMCHHMQSYAIICNQTQSDAIRPLDRIT